MSGGSTATPPWCGTASPRCRCYADNQPVIVESAEGHELIDVDGNRYLDAISSLWVTTLGHRVPELDEAVREQLDRVAHTTLLGNGNRAVIELAEALAPKVPVPEPHFLFASDGAAAVEQALKIAFQYWTNLGVTGRTRYLALGGAYHGDTVGRSLRRRRWLRHRRVRPAALPGAAGARLRRPRLGRHRLCPHRRPRRRARRRGDRAAGAGRGGHGRHRPRIGAAGRPRPAGSTASC